MHRLIVLLLNCGDAKSIAKVMTASACNVQVEVVCFQSCVFVAKIEFFAFPVSECDLSCSRICYDFKTDAVMHQF